MKRVFNSFLNDIIIAIDSIKDYTKDMSYVDFSKDKKTFDAVSRNLEIIGEASINIPIEIKNKYKNVPWKSVKDFRNVVVHQYWKVDLEIEWTIIETKLDILKKQIEKVIEKEK